MPNRIHARLGVLAVVLLGGCGGPPSGAARDRLAGIASCAGCHALQTRHVEYGPHRVLECEECHGPGAAHARGDDGARPALFMGGAAQCLGCHGKEEPSTARSSKRIASFEEHLKTVEAMHRVTLDRSKVGERCVDCHDPHLLE